MDPEKHRQIARSAGRKAHQQGSAHEFTSSEAAAAGRLGGQQVSKNREHMREIGKRGGRRRSILAKLSGPAVQVFESLCAGKLVLCQLDSAFILGPIARGGTVESAPRYARRDVIELYKLGLVRDCEAPDGVNPRGWLQLTLTARAKRTAVAKSRAVEKRQKLGGLLKQLREEAGLTRRVLGEQTNMAEATIRAIEIGGSAARPWTLQKLLRSPAMATLPQKLLAAGLGMLRR